MLCGHGEIAGELSLRKYVERVESKYDIATNEVMLSRLSNPATAQHHDAAIYESVAHSLMPISSQSHLQWILERRPGIVQSGYVTEAHTLSIWTRVGEAADRKRTGR